MEPIEQLRLISQGGAAGVASVAEVLVAVWSQHCEGAVDKGNWISILERNRVALLACEPSAVRDLAVESVDQLLSTQH